MPYSLGQAASRRNEPPRSFRLHFSKVDYLTGLLLVVTECYTPGHGNVIKLINTLPYLTYQEKEDFRTSAHIIWGLGYYPGAPLLTTLVQEASFLLLARYAIMFNEINMIMGKQPNYSSSGSDDNLCDG